MVATARFATRKITSKISRAVYDNVPIKVLPLLPPCEQTRGRTRGFYFQSWEILFTSIKLPLAITWLLDTYSHCVTELPNPFHLVYSNILVTNFKPHVVGGEVGDLTKKLPHD